MAVGHHLEAAAGWLPRHVTEEWWGGERGGCGPSAFHVEGGEAWVPVGLTEGRSMSALQEGPAGRGGHRAV